MTPRPAGRPPPVPSPAVPPTPLSAPGGPPEKGLLSTSTPHGLIRRPGTPAGTPGPAMGESHILTKHLALVDIDGLIRIFRHRSVLISFIV